jgi:hypothetical protein
MKISVLIDSYFSIFAKKNIILILSARHFISYAAAPLVGCVINYFTAVINTMEQRTFKNVNNCLNTNIYSYLETSGG